MFTHREDDNIVSFLNETNDIPLADSRKLLGLAAATTHRIGWFNVCSIYRKAVQFGGPREGIYINWLQSAQQILDMMSHDLQIKNAQAIIEESLEILQDAMQSHPRHSGFAYLMGLFNYKISELADTTSQFEKAEKVEKALSWFRRAEEWQKEDYDEVDDRIRYYIGQCYFDLHHWKKAVEYFESVNEQAIEREEDQKILNQLRSNSSLAKDAIKQL